MKALRRFARDFLTREGWAIRIAGWLPNWLVYWATIRCISHGTTGEYGHTQVAHLPAMEALNRWHKDCL